VHLLLALLIVVLVTAAVLVISAPLRRERTRGTAGETPAVQAQEGGVSGADRAELEAEREAKYREIRDAELDFRTGKLSPDDYRAVDAQLRAEAVAILDRLERLDEAD
jgi:flagellar biosynthesis/type III secretory pathway M-ring protein FliF/YscJ